MSPPYLTVNGASVLSGSVDDVPLGTDRNFYYLLPYSNTYKILVQFGSRGSSNTGLTYPYAYATIPVTFITLTSAGNYSFFLTGQTVIGFTYDSNTTVGYKPGINYLSIGLVANGSAPSA